jgi:hypothetical protein
MMHFMQPPHPREPRSDRLVTTRKSCLESDAPFFFPCKECSGLEGVGTELINAAFDLGGRALPEGELLVELWGGREGDLVSKRDEGTIAGACDRVECGTWRERYEGVNEDGNELT